MGANEQLDPANFAAQYYGAPPQTLDSGAEGNAGEPMPSVWNMISERTYRGVPQTQQMYHNAWIMGDDSLSDDERKERISDGPLMRYLNAQGKLNDQAYEASPWYAQAAADAGQMLPAMGASLGEGAAYGAAASAVPFSLAGAASKIPVVGPAAAGLLGGAGALNFEAGFVVGSFKSMQTQAAGEIYGDLIQSGISHKAARPLALAYGSINGALESLSLNKLGKLAGKALDVGTKGALSRQLTSPFVKRLQKNAFARLGADYLESVATEGGTEYAQQFMQSVAEYHAAVLERSDPGDFDWKNAHEKSKEAFMHAVAASALLGAGTGIGSYSIGKGKASVQSVLSDQRIREALEQLKDTDPKQVINNLRNAVQEMDYPWEKDTNGTVQYTATGQAFIVAGTSKTGGETELDASQPTPADEGILTPEEVLGQAPAEPVEGDAQPVLEIKDGKIQIAQGTQDALAQASETYSETGDTEQALDVLFGEKEPKDFVTPEELDANAREIGPAMESTPMTPIEVQARKNQIASDLKVLRREEMNLDAKFKQAEKTGRNTEATLQKLETVLRVQEQLKLERELLESGLMDREGVAQQSGKLRMSQISRLVSSIQKSATRLDRMKQKMDGKVATMKDNAKTAKAAATQKANDKAAKAKAAGEKSGRFQENRNIRAMQDQLIQLVNATTVDKNQRNELKAMINKVTNAQQFQKAAQRMITKIAKMDAANSKKRSDTAKAKLIGEIDKLLKVGKTKLSAGKPVNAKLDADTTAKLNTFKNFVQNDTAAAAHITAFMQKTVDVNGTQVPYATLMSTGQGHLINPNDLVNFQIASMAMGLNKKSEIELNIIKGNLAQWVLDGRNAVAQKQAILAQQRADEDAIAEQSVAPSGHDGYEGNPDMRTATTQTLESTAANWLNWDDLMRFISPQDASHEIATLLDPTEARRNYYVAQDTMKMGAIQTMQDALRLVNTHRDIHDKMNEDSQSEFRLSYKKKGGKAVEATYNKAQLIDIWMKLQDPDLHDTMRDDTKGNGWTLTGDVPAGQSFEEVLESALDAEDIAIGNALLEFYDTYHARVNNAFRDKYGADLPKKDNYSPVSRESYDVVPGSQQAHDLMFTSLLPGSAKSRVNSIKALKPQNAYNLMSKHIDSWEHFMAFDGILGSMKNVFSNDRINKIIEQRHGYGTKQVIDKYIDRFIRDTPMEDAGDGSDWLYRAMRADISKAALGLKQGYQMATQLSSGVALWAETDIRDIMKGYVQAALHPKETERVLRSSPILARRFREGNSVDIEAALKKNGVGAEVLSRLFGIEQVQLEPAQYDMMTRLMFDGIRYGDAGVARMFGAPLYWAERGKGKSEQEALLVVERAMERTQQGDTVEQLPNYWAQNPGLYTFFGMFSLQPQQMLSHSMIAQRDLGNELAAAKLNPAKTAAAMAKFGQKALSYWLLPGLFFGLVKTLPALFAPPPSDDEDRNREIAQELVGSTILGPISGAGLVGAMVEGVWFAGSKQFFGLDKKHMIDYLGKNNLTKTYFDNPYAVFKAWEKLTKPEDPDAIPSGDSEELDPNAKRDEFLAKAGRMLAPVGGYPAAIVNTPVNLTNALQNGDWLGAMFALQGWSASSLKTRQGSEEDPNALPGGEEENTPTSYYDSFVQGYLENQKNPQREPEEEEAEEPDYQNLFLQGALSGNIDENAGE